MKFRTLKRHMMPMVALGVFVLTVAPAGLDALGHLALGILLLLLYWLLEWRGIQGSFEDRSPRHPVIMISRAFWLAGLIICVLDTLWFHWTPWQGLAVKIGGVVVFLSSLGLRFWSMLTLGRAFSYDLKVDPAQRLVTAGPYRLVRHPSYLALLLWSASFAFWNPSLPGFIMLMIATVPQIVLRIHFEEHLLKQHFGERWLSYQAESYALIPLLW